MKWFILFLVVFFAAIFGPFITIWALNTLFPALAIPYNIETYFAVIAMSVFFNANFSTKKD